MKLPKARTGNLLEQNLKNETLIYDLKIDKAFNLNETLSFVYKACNGITTFDELKRKYKFSDDFIYLALDELKRNNLLADQNYVSPFATTTRRDVIKKVGLASMMVLPIITGLVAPKAVNAASNGAGAPSGAASVYGRGCNTAEDCNQRTFCFSGSCCEPPTRSEVINPGQNRTAGPRTTELNLIANGESTTTTCADHFGCCDGSTPYGTYEYVTPTGDLLEFAGDNPEGYSYYYTSYNCSCRSL